MDEDSHTATLVLVNLLSTKTLSTHFYPLIGGTNSLFLTHSTVWALVFIYCLFGPHSGAFGGPGSGDQLLLGLKPRSPTFKSPASALH